MFYYGRIRNDGDKIIMRFLYLQDTHIKGINPCNRKGDYYQDIMSKIKETISLSEKLEVDYVIHGGDLYDSPNVSNLMVDELVDLIEKAKIQWYILPGTHDEIGHNWELSKGVSLAHIFRRSKLITELIALPNKNGYVIQGFRYYHNCEQDIKTNGLKCQYPNAKFRIAVTHAFITLKPFLPQVMHVVAKDIKTDFNVVLVAHYHAQWGIKDIGGVKYVSLGCFGRTSIDEVGIKPTVALIDTSTQEIKLIPLKNAKMGSEVFNLEGVEKMKNFEGEIDKFIKSLDSTKFQALDIKGLVEHLSKENNVEKEVKDCVIERIGGFENEE